jgi:esterase/lipase superfamily enzyme
MQFVRQELVPAIYADCGGQALPIWAAGASIGAYNAVTMVTSFPDVFTRAVAMSGTYDLKRFLNGYHDEDVHLISPLLYLSYVSPDSAYADKLRETFVLLPTGEGKWEDPAESWKVANALGRLGVPNRVDLWGKDRPHDWMTWRDMLPKYLADWTQDAKE